MLKKQVMTGIYETVLRFQNYCSINLKKKQPKKQIMTIEIWAHKIFMYVASH